MNIKVTAFTVSEKSINIDHMETVMLKRLNRNHGPQFPAKNQQQWFKRALSLILVKRISHPIQSRCIFGNTFLKGASNVFDGYIYSTDPILHGFYVQYSRVCVFSHDRRKCTNLENC